MSIAIASLFVLNYFLAIALFVARMAEMDRDYIRQVQEDEEYKSHFRRRW